MDTNKEDIFQPLTPEEIRLVREMLEKAGLREQKTATASKKSFMDYFSAISVTETLWSLAEKIKSLPWEQISNYIFGCFR